ncbi:chromosome segregation protein SMC [uncultured Lactobacillus sp.]|uniref:chromosome segregation protein SMC n=1 Tax=uncultured Lactobacillus sp. TaxID=153152 RepID=UPI00260D5618|nr:chromosome segregation protein SMC [uncultured Lactobacillus sp.]
MPLKQLILNGFKSFADKTTINFDKGITGIVGPNGSGKSNITEAIRWVMGEGSAKSLRGENMKDVIFAGSEFRAPLNKAEVSLVFDNTDKQLNFNNDKVAVTRRILRSGDSEYLINNQQVRLKDIRDLFVDSGLSQDSLAIISQGKVDQILNSHPEDRRGIFEEAAGVLHFKQQKEIALRQLDKTNENLIRINDLVKELEDRVEPLHEQSSLAKEYKFEKAQLDEKLKKLLALQIQDLDSKKREVKQKADQNKAILNKLDREVQSSQTDLEAKKAASQALHTQKDNQQKSLLSFTQKLASLNTDLQMSQQSKEYDQATRKEYLAQKSELEAQKSELNGELAEIQAKIDEQKAILKQLSEKKDQISSSLKQDPASLNKQLEQTRSKYIDLLQSQTSTNNQIVYLENEIKRLNAPKSEDAHLNQELSEAKSLLDQYKEQGEKLVSQRKELKSQIEALTNKVTQQSKRLDDLNTLIQQTQANIARQNAQLDGLKRLQDRHEGYYYGVKYVLNHLSEFNGIVGVIGELLSFPADLEAALTTALGAGVQNLVARDRESAKNAISLLKRSHAGRATFLPLDSLRLHTIAQSTLTTLESIEGFIGVASRLVSTKGNVDITNAINYLLGNVLVAKDMNTALRIQNRTGHYYRIVTLDGDIISPGGSMTGGARSQRSNSPLQMNAELESLGQSISKQRKQLADYERQLAEFQKDSDNEALNDKKAQLQELNQKIAEQAIRFQNQEKEVNRYQRLADLQKQAKKQQADELNKLIDQLKEQKNKKLTINNQANDQKAKMDELKQTLADVDQAYAKLQNDLAEINSQIAVAKNKQANLKERFDQVQKQIKNNSNQLNDLENKLRGLDQANSSNQSQEDITEQIDNLTKEKELLTQKLAETNQNLGKLDAQINHLESVASRNYDLRKDAAEDQEALSVELSQFTSQINQKLRHLSQDYSLTYEAAISLTDGKNDLEVRQQLEKEVKLHKMSIEDIGPVNLQSIEEYEDVKTRYDFLNGQQNDLLKARSDIQESMSKLDNEVKDRFGKTFNEVEKRFEKIFPVMFGGGHAKLVLTQPDDLLMTGVEIIAQPPGKKLQKLSLLSGGERALTAITLLFAMLEVNPVPFCILDEVEAALDEANVDRFAKFLNHYDLHTQFIVITHRRGTMQKADNLYGVVMQESGVSQVLSVSLKDIKQEVN